VTYLDLISSHLRRFGADEVLIALVEDYLENDRPTNEPPWRLGHCSIVQKAIDYGNSKRFRLSRFQGRLDGRHRKRALQQGYRTKESKQLMIERLRKLGKLICRSSEQVR
jgi:hypothetical protein